MSLLSRPIVDDRGRTVEVPLPEIGHTTGPGRKGLLSAARLAVHAIPVARSRRLVRALIAGAAAMALVALLGSQVGFSGPKGDFVGVLWVGGLVGLGIGFGAYNLIRVGPPLSEARSLLSAAQLCLVCGYDLVGLMPEADGCTVCPECGAGFRLGLGNPESQRERPMP